MAELARERSTGRTSRTGRTRGETDQAEVLCTCTVRRNQTLPPACCAFSATTGAVRSVIAQSGGFCRGVRDRSVLAYVTGAVTTARPAPAKRERSVSFGKSVQHRFTAGIPDGLDADGREQFGIFHGFFQFLQYPCPVFMLFKRKQHKIIIPCLTSLF